ncbi:prephenate dehydratase [Ascosphaera aggregata]|nr:prephenate dehydratase [Ascosphaera aggregata]
MSSSIETRYSSVRKLYTHPQAWGQCEQYLSKYFKGVERQDTSSTSRAAQIVALLSESEEDTAAAIASKFAADVNDELELIAENIEDVSGNTTRFLILKNVEAPTSADPITKSTPSPPAKKKTLISFEIDHNQSGALATALMIFKEHGLNLTSINSRPGLVQPWQYIFFVECERQPVFQSDDTAVAEVMQALQKVTESCKLLGSWANQLA